MFLALDESLAQFPVPPPVKSKASSQPRVDEKVKPIKKQVYRQLSPYKKTPPKPAKKLSSVKKKQRKQIQALIKKAEINPSRLSLRKSLARALHQLKLYQLMVDHLMPYNDKLDRNTMLLLVDALENRNMHLEQVKLLKDLALKYPNNSRIQYKLGLAYYNYRDADNAVESLRKAIQLRPNFYPPYKTLLSLFKETQNIYESRELLKNTLAQFGETPKLLSELCELTYKDNLIDQGITVCSKAYGADVNNVDNLIYLGQLQMKSGMVAEGQDNILRAANKNYGNEFAQWAAGQIYLEKKNYHVALRYFKAAVKANSKSARARLGHALSLFALDKYEAALNEFKISCDYDKKLTKDPFRVAANKVKQAKNYDWTKPYDTAAKRCRFTDLINMDQRYKNP